MAVSGRRGNQPRKERKSRAIFVEQQNLFFCLWRSPDLGMVSVVVVVVVVLVVVLVVVVVVVVVVLVGATFVLSDLCMIQKNL